MAGLRVAAALAALGVLAAWGASAATAPTAADSARPPAVPPQNVGGMLRHSLGGGAEVVTPVAGQPPVTGVPWFLTIGDSVTFGYTRDPRLSGVNDSWALDLQRLLASRGERWTLFDTACPGETTASYSTRCFGRRQVPFLGDTSQRAVVLAAIGAHRADLRLIVVELGSNDLLHALAGSLVATVATMTANLASIVDELHSAAPRVPVVLADIYDPFAMGAPRTDQLLTAIDATLAALAARLDTGFANFHQAINHPADGAPLCTLVDCADLDIHPTPLGHQRLAEAVLAALPG